MADATATRRKLVLGMSVSLDGFVAGPNGEADWIFRSKGDSHEVAWVAANLRSAGAHIMGSRTFYGMASFWPYSDSPLAPAMNDIPKVIFSRQEIKDGTRVDRATQELAAETAASIGARQGVTPTASVLKSWAEPSVARGDLAEEVVRLKEQPGNFILAHGGAEFARSLVASGLVDEYRLGLHPVVLGRGQPLFSGLQNPVDLKLISATPFNSGVVAAVYRPA